MIQISLSYSQLRAILCLSVQNTTLKAFLSDILSGKVSSFSELELIEIIAEARLDTEIVRIISGKDPDTMDAITALEYISSFFEYIRANSARFQSWLASSGLALPLQKPQPTPLKPLK